VRAPTCKERLLGPAAGDRRGRWHACLGNRSRSAVVVPPILNYTRRCLTRKPSQVAAVALALLLLAACDEVNRDAFAGVKGAVGYPPVSDCLVEVYNALTFEHLDSAQGRIATGRTNSAGRFSIELDEHYLGRPLVLVARPDSRAM